MNLKLKINFIVTIIATLTVYVCMELMFVYMPYASLFNPFVFSGITNIQGVFLLANTITALIFAVGGWIEIIKKIEIENKENKEITDYLSKE